MTNKRNRELQHSERKNTIHNFWWNLDRNWKFGPLELFDETSLQIWKSLHMSVCKMNTFQWLEWLWMKIRNFVEIFGRNWWFGWTKNDILDNMLLIHT